jgi:hypothetical protein
MQIEEGGRRAALEQARAPALAEPQFNTTAVLRPFTRHVVVPLSSPTHHFYGTQQMICSHTTDASLAR